jgi:serine protease Do
VEKSRRDVLKVGLTGVAAGSAGCLGLRSELAPRTASSDAGDPESRSGATDTGEFSSDAFERAEATARDARDGVVTVRGENGSGGTGWVIDADRGHVVTNSHVVAESTSFSVETFAGATAGAARIGYHESLVPDVALLETDADGLTELPVGNEADLEPGDPLVTVGHPGAVGNWIMSIGRHDSYEPGIDWLLSTVPTSRGNSGGPLMTVDGEVVGVVSGSTRESRDDYSKSDELYTELPSTPSLTTSVPATTAVESLEEWA